MEVFSEVAFRHRDGHAESVFEVHRWPRLMSICILDTTLVAGLQSASLFVSPLFAGRLEEGLKSDADCWRFELEGSVDLVDHQ